MSPRMLVLTFVFALPTLASAQDAIVRGRTVKEWMQGLKSVDPRVRFWSLQALGEAGGEAAAATASAARLLKDAHPQIRRESAKVLAAIGPEAASAAPALAAALGDADAGVRQIAAGALAELGDKAMPALIEALKSKETSVRLGALGAMEGMEPHPETTRAVILATKEGIPATRRAAVAVLAKYGASDPDAQETLVALLRDKDLGLRQAAAAALIGAGKESQPHFLKASDDPNPAVRLLCLQALAQLGDDLEEAGVLAFRKALDHPDARLRQQAASALGGLGVKARDLGGGPKLADRLFELAAQDKELTVRRAAAWALGQIGIDSPEEVLRLAQGLKDADPSVRSLTVQALGQYLHDETPAEWREPLISALAEGLKDRDRRVQNAAADLLSKQGEAALGPLTKLVETGGGTARMFAAYLLGEIGANAAAAAPALEKMVREGSPESRSIAQQALQKIKG